ncbi:MAG: tetratricopeptide repeat protein [Planctomycetota bacterium]|nr:MAG: tetratricopeptide repeat protein [Planctomycetota bacterium]
MESGPRLGHRTARSAALLLPALAAVLLFLPILRHGFVYDDLPMLQDNAYLGSWSGLWEGFQVPLWETVSKSRFAASFYRPVGIAAFTVLRQIGGGDPAPFHAASLLLHALCSTLVALLALRLGLRPLVAGCAGLLFAAHGAHVETVAWACALTYLLATAFSLLALIALAGGRLGWCAALLLPAMLSQETAFGAAALCFAIAVRTRTPRWHAGVLLLPVALVYVLRCLVFHDWSAGLLGESVFDAVDPARGFGLADQVALALSMIGRYLGFLLWPWPHQPFRPLQLDVQAGDPGLWVPAAAGLAAIVVAAWIWLRHGRRAPLVLYGLGILMAALVPALSVWNLGQFAFEERYPYLASTGFCVLLPGLLLGARAAPPPRPRLAAGLAVAVLAVAGNAYSAAVTLPHWRDNLTFFGWAREAAPNAVISHVEYAGELLRRAEAMPRGAPQREAALEAALQVLSQAQDLRRQPWFIHPVDWMRLHTLIGSALLLEQDLRTAEAFYRTLLEHTPGSPDAHNGMGTVLAMRAARALERGEDEAAQADFAAALSHFQTALNGDPYLREALLGAGKCLTALGSADQAVAPLQRAFEMGPGDPAYAEALAEALIQTGRYGEARRILARHMQEHGDSFAGPFMTGVSFAAEGERLRFEGRADESRALTLQSLPWFEQALERGPANDKAAFNVGRACVELQRYAEALPYLERAFAARPQDPGYALYLLTAQEQLGFPAQAAATIQRHLEAAPGSPLRAELEAALPQLLERIPREPSR